MPSCPWASCGNVTTEPDLWEICGGWLPAVRGIGAAGGTAVGTGRRDRLSAQVRTGAAVVACRPSMFWGALWGVACPAPGACVAVGQYNTDSNQDSLPQIDTLSHGTWTAAITGSLPVDAGRKSQYAYALHVSCAPTGDCVALAAYTNRQGYQESVIESTTPL